MASAARRRSTEKFFLTVRSARDYHLCIIHKSAHRKRSGAFVWVFPVIVGRVVPKKCCAHPGCSRLIEVGASYCPAHANVAKRDRDRSVDQVRAAKPWRKWYSRAAWRGPKGRRTLQLRREPLCQMCPTDSRRLAEVVDHVVPHRGDYGLFWFGDLQSLCKACHDGKKQRAERRGGGAGKV